MFKAYVEQKRGHGVSLTEAPRMKKKIRFFPLIRTEEVALLMQFIIREME